MKQLPCTKGFTILCDDEDYERLSQRKWYAHNCGGLGRVDLKRPARRDSVPPRKVSFLVHEVVGKAPSGMVVDHINGDPFDNRKINLRFATVGQNCRNQRRKRKANGCGKGVHLINGTLRVHITDHGNTFTFHGFETVREAELAYDALALHLHGEFAALNHPSIPTMPKSPEEVQAFLDARRPSARVLQFLRSGLTPQQAAVIADCSLATAHKVARAHGLSRSRGRPRKAAA